VDEASARARVKREIEVAESDPRYWLTHQARSEPGLDGWTEPIPEVPDASVVHVPSSEDMSLVVAELISSGAIRGPRCADPSCACALHASEVDDDT
jgi:hypothetical protein